MAPDFSLAQRGQRLLLFLRALQAVNVHRLALLGGKPVPHWRVAGALTLAQHNGQGMEQDVANRMMIIICRPQQQSPGAGGVNRLAVQHLNNRFQLVKRQFAFVADGHHDPHALLFAKRHGHATARFGAHAVGQQVVKGAGKRNGQGNVSDGHRIFLT